MGKITQNELKKLLSYDSGTGIFTWTISPAKNIKSGTQAGGERGGGYTCITISGRSYYAHLLAWLYVHGVFPQKKLDHRDLNKTNNRICNLREVSDTENSWNTPITSRNSVGIKGVTFHKSRNKYLIRVQKNYRVYNGGRFDKLEDAKTAVEQLRNKLHEEFACHE